MINRHKAAVRTVNAQVISCLILWNLFILLPVTDCVGINNLQGRCLVKLFLGATTHKSYLSLDITGCQVPKPAPVLVLVLVIEER